MHNGVELDFYKEEYTTILEDYYLEEEQLKFTNLPIEALGKGKVREDYYPIVIQWKGNIAGFFVLHGWEGVQVYSENEKAMLLRAYSIHPSQQGKGIATASLQLLPTFIKENFPYKNEIILGVNHKNFLAQHVYKKVGFIDKGKRVLGRSGELMILHMGLS